MSSSPSPGAALPQELGNAVPVQRRSSHRPQTIPEWFGTSSHFNTRWAKFPSLFCSVILAMHVIILNMQSCEIKCQLLDKSHPIPLQCLLKEKNKRHHNCCVSQSFEDLRWQNKGNSERSISYCPSSWPSSHCVILFIVSGKGKNREGDVIYH